MFSELSFIFTTYGWYAGLVAVIILTIGKFLWNRSKVVPEDGGESDDHSDDKIELSNNQFFTNSDHKLNNEIPLLRLEGMCAGREEVFRDLLTIKISKIREHCSLIIDNDLHKFTSMEWARMVYDHLGAISREFEDEARRHGVPEIVIRKFSLWHEDSMRFIYSHVMTLSASMVYRDNYTRTSTFLTLMNILLITTIGDAEKTLVDINGELNGIYYKDKPLGTMESH